MEIKNLLLQVTDDFKPGVCLDGAGKPLCPMAARGCYVQNPENCPIMHVQPLQEISHNSPYGISYDFLADRFVTNDEKKKVVRLFALEVKE